MLAFVFVFVLVGIAYSCGCDGVLAADLTEKGQHADCYYNSGYTRDDPPDDAQNARDYYWI